MLPKKDREIISKIGRYQYNKMKELNLDYEQFLEHQKNKQKEKELKNKLGYNTFNKMKELGLNYEEYKQYQKEQKLKKYEKKREKDKIRFRTIRYIERYCDLEMKCQICDTKDNVQIHHPNYKDYLKVNLLCKKHHDQLHKFELVPPLIVDLEKIAIKKQVQKQRQEYLDSQIENIKTDIFKNNFSYSQLNNKYGISAETVKRYLQKQEQWKDIERKLKETRKRNSIKSKSKNYNNPIQKYRNDNNLTAKEFSQKFNIPVPTIRAIECGKTSLLRIKPKTRKKLEIILVNK